MAIIQAFAANEFATDTCTDITPTKWMHLWPHETEWSSIILHIEGKNKSQHIQRSAIKGYCNPFILTAVYVHVFREKWCC